SPAFACANEQRKEPSPLSLRLRTVRVLRRARSSRPSSAGRKRRRVDARRSGPRHNERAGRGTRWENFDFIGGPPGQAKVREGRTRAHDGPGPILGPYFPAVLQFGIDRRLEPTGFKTGSFP